MITVLVGHPSPVGAVWRDALPYLQKAIDHSQGEYEVDDLMEFVDNRDMQLWTIQQDDKVIGAGVTEIVTYPRKTYVQIVLLGADNMDDWLNSIQNIEAWAKEMNVNGVRWMGRPGWKKVMQSWGYSQDYIAMGKPL